MFETVSHVWPRARRWGIVAGEIMAVIATIFALFEVFFARRLAPIHVAGHVACNAPEMAQTPNKLNDFLVAHGEGFVFLDLDLAQIRRCLGEQRAVTFAGETLLALPGGYLVYSRESLDQAVLARLDTEEDFIEERLRGLFYATDRPGEGESYHTLIPAPFDSGTERMHACTSALMADGFWARVGGYIGRCILT